MNRTRWKLAVAILALLPWPFTAPAQNSPEQASDVAPAQSAAAIPTAEQPTKEQLAKLFEVMRLRQQFDGVMRMLPAMMQQQMHAQMQEMLAKMPAASQLTPAQQAALDQLMDKYMQQAANLYPADEMIDDATAVYRRHMSRSDVDAYIAFYSSAPGQHLLDAQPVIMKEYMPLVMQRVQARSRQLTGEMMNDLQEFIRTQLPAGAAAPPAK